MMVVVLMKMMIKMTVMRHRLKERYYEADNHLQLMHEEAGMIVVLWGLG